MNTRQLQVCMLGNFSIRCNETEISDSDNRSKKVWLLLAYMIYHRNRAIAQDELINLLWGEEESSSNPVNALKTMFHRVRTTLDQLGEHAGHTLIIRKGGNYTWNPDVSFFFDITEFESLCKSAKETEDHTEQLELFLKALNLYRGDFLSGLSTESWVVPISAYFHNLYIQTVQTAIALLKEAGRHHDIVTLCKNAVAVDPYNEQLYQHLMRALLDLGEQSSALSVFENMSELLLSNFGIMPAEESQALLREAERTVNNRAISPSVMREQLQETSFKNGALYCDYDFFKIIYQAEARVIIRSGDAVHIGLLSVSGQDDTPLSRRSLDVCMENLQNLICSNLRKGDIASR